MIETPSLHPVRTLRLREFGNRRNHRRLHPPGGDEAALGAVRAANTELNPRYTASLERRMAAMKPQLLVQSVWAPGGSIVATVVVDPYTRLITDWSAMFVAHAASSASASPVVSKPVAAVPATSAS